jgi:hypothetical protein
VDKADVAVESVSSGKVFATALDVTLV